MLVSDVKLMFAENSQYLSMSIEDNSFLIGCYSYISVNTFK